MVSICIHNLLSYECGRSVKISLHQRYCYQFIIYIYKIIFNVIYLKNLTILNLKVGSTIEAYGVANAYAHVNAPE